MRTLSNGYIVLDHGETLQGIPAGYEIAADNPRVLLPCLPLCNHRQVSIRTCCGGTGKQEHYFCKRFNLKATRGKCTTCGGEG